MAFTVYPVGADSGFSEESAINSERDRLIAALGGRMHDHIVDPFAGGDFSLTTSTSSYDVDVAAGDAFVGGHFVRSGSTVTVTVDGSTTNELFLVVDDGESNNASITYTSDGSTPSGQYVVKTHEVTTDGSGVTGTADFRPYVPFPVVDATTDDVTGTKRGTSPDVAIDSTGVKTVSVTFNNPYRTQLSNVVLVVDAITDTAANFGWWRPVNESTDGFDVEVKVTKSGGSGSTANFTYTARGY